MRFLAWALAVFIRLVSISWRVETDTSGIATDNNNVVYAFRHGDLLPLAAIHRDQGLYAMVSRSRDGQLAADALAWLGFFTLRGGSSGGGASALRQSVKCLASGGAVGVAVDGPRGPRGQVRPGVEYLAAKTGCTVRWAVVEASLAIRLPTWDEFVIPLPFSRLRVVYGDIAAVETQQAGVLASQLESLFSPSVAADSRGRLSRALTTAEASVGLPSRE